MPKISVGCGNGSYELCGEEVLQIQQITAIVKLFPEVSSKLLILIDNEILSQSTRLNFNNKLRICCQDKEWQR